MKILPSLCRWTLIKNVDGEEDASRLPALSKAVLLDRGRLPHHVLVDIFSGESFGGILSCMAALISGDIGAGDPGASPFAFAAAPLAWNPFAPPTPLTPPLILACACAFLAVAGGLDPPYIRRSYL